MAASANAHYIWYYFAGIGLVAAFALLAFAKITNKMDKKDSRYVQFFFIVYICGHFTIAYIQHENKIYKPCQR